MHIRSAPAHLLASTRPWRAALQAAAMHQVRGSLASVTLDGKVFALGGGEVRVNLDTTEIYDPGADMWIMGTTWLCPCLVTGP